jgi:hypothetical protein
MSTQNVQSPQAPAPQAEPEAGGGPVVAIVLGVIIIVAAVVLVMTVGEKDMAQTPAPEKPKPTAESKPAAAKPAEAKPAEPKAAETKPAAGTGGIEAHLKAAREYADKTVGSKAPAGMADVPVELPNPAFAGTPKAIPAGARMKALTGKDRGPYFLPKDLAGAIKDLALEKPVTSSDSAPLIGDLKQVTDGDKEPLDGRWVELAPGKQWVQVDLGASTENFAVYVWHNHMEARIYKDVVVQVSDEPDFISPITVFNNDFDNSSGLGKGDDYEYFENYEGLLVPLYDPATGKGIKFRYVRAFSKGSTSDDANHYTEVEVWGRPGK